MPKRPKDPKDWRLSQRLESLTHDLERRQSISISSLLTDPMIERVKSMTQELLSLSEDPDLRVKSMTLEESDRLWSNIHSRLIGLTFYLVNIADHVSDPRPKIRSEDLIDLYDNQSMILRLYGLRDSLSSLSHWLLEISECIDYPSEKDPEIGSDSLSSMEQSIMTQRQLYYPGIEKTRDRLSEVSKDTQRVLTLEKTLIDLETLISQSQSLRSLFADFIRYDLGSISETLESKTSISGDSEIWSETADLINILDKKTISLRQSLSDFLSYFEDQENMTLISGLVSETLSHYLADMIDHD